jgi:two-component system response regulator NreC
MPISVLLADEHPLLVSGLRAWLAHEHDVAVVGGTSDGDDVWALLAALTPDVLVLDLTMGGSSGLEVLRRLVAERSRTRVVVLSMHATASHALKAVRLGALGYVAKQAPSSELLAAIRAAACGRRYVAPPLSQSILSDYEQRLESGEIDLFDTLSPRQRQVMRYAALGYNSRETAAKLLIGKRTVESHLAEVNERLRVQSRSDLVRHAVRVGLISSDCDSEGK